MLRSPDGNKGSLAMTVRSQRLLRLALGFVQCQSRNDKWVPLSQNVYNDEWVSLPYSICNDEWVPLPQSVCNADDFRFLKVFVITKRFSAHLQAKKKS